MQMLSRLVINKTMSVLHLISGCLVKGHHFIVEQPHVLGLAFSQGDEMMIEIFVPGDVNRPDKVESIVKHATALIEQNKHQCD